MTQAGLIHGDDVAGTNINNPGPDRFILFRDNTGAYRAKLPSGDTEEVGGGGGLSSIESGIFTLNGAGTVATGGVLTNPGVTPTLTITTIKKLKLWHGVVFQTLAPENNSRGISDSVIQNCTRTDVVSQPSPPAPPGIIDTRSVVDNSNCINVSLSGNNWLGLITAISDNSYSITFTRGGIGSDITGQWHGIMG